MVVGILCLWGYLKFLEPVVRTRGCAFRALTGMFCPGCGGTRAMIAFLTGHFLQSIWYHPLVPYSGVLYFGFMLTHTLVKIPFVRKAFPRLRGMRFRDWYMYVAIGLVILNCILKNVLFFVFRIPI